MSGRNMHRCRGVRGKHVVARVLETRSMVIGCKVPVRPKFAPRSPSKRRCAMVPEASVLLEDVDLSPSGRSASGARPKSCFDFCCHEVSLLGLTIIRGK